ncbi:MAG: hypothetical protein HY725_18020 [Candidatus Rokubacteria bacterium]|nr:hypothetical protein [Candidatus Rokubacteria bacterium]
MRSFARVAVVIAMVALWAAGRPEAQEGLMKQDRQGPVTVAVTLTAPPAVGAPVKVKVVFDTHSVGLDAIAFDQAVVLRTGAGADVAPTAVEQAQGGGHHRSALVVFPPLAQAEPVRIVVKNVGGVAERSFVWELGPAR